MDDFKPLPAPHGNVAVRTEWTSQNHVTVEYIGSTLEALRVAGCIDEETFNFFVANPRKRTAPSGDGEFSSDCRRRKNKDVEITRRFFAEGADRARALPGVTAYQAPKEKPRNFIEFAEQVAKAAASSGVGDGAAYNHRMRAVGRFRREVEWVSVGGLVVAPNWRQIRMNWMVQRAIDNTLT